MNNNKIEEVGEKKLFERIGFFLRRYFIFSFFMLVAVFFVYFFQLKEELEQDENHEHRKLSISEQK